MVGDGSVMAEIRDIIRGKSGCGIRDPIYHKPTDRMIGFRGYLQLNADIQRKFIFTGFDYRPPPPESIGVMKKLVKIGLDQGRLILVYFQDGGFPRSMVFHPVAFEKFGEAETKATERQARDERWVNLDRDFSCTLRDLASGRDEPRTDAETARDGDLTGWFE